MSRMSAGGDQILVKPTNNVYTVLVVIGIIAEVLAFVYMWMRHTDLIGTNLLPGQ
jgi:hypothetical protein